LSEADVMSNTLENEVRWARNHRREKWGGGKMAASRRNAGAAQNSVTPPGFRGKRKNIGYIRGRGILFSD